MEGGVNDNLEAVIALPLQDSHGQILEAKAVVDTGFSACLSLPPVLMEDLKPPAAGDGEAVLADDSQAAFDMYGVTVLWDGQSMYVER